MNDAAVIVKRHKPRPQLPTRWPWLFRGFRKYSVKYAAKYFHGVRIAKHGRPPKSWAGPAIIVMNHPSWWDPIIAFILSGFWPNRLDFAPIDDKALKQYRFLSKVGLFGIEIGTASGARAFVRTSRSILAHDQATLWLTAQGEFMDCRARPVRLRPGVGFLADEMDRGVIIPVAVEYSFWNERTPEALLAFGPKLEIAHHRDWDKETWTERIAQILETTQDRLAADAQSRDPKRFDTIVSGRVGVGGFYDFGRRLQTWLSGRRFRANHSPPFADE